MSDLKFISLNTDDKKKRYDNLIMYEPLRRNRYAISINGLNIHTNQISSYNLKMENARFKIKLEIMEMIGNELDISVFGDRPLLILNHLDPTGVIVSIKRFCIVDVISYEQYGSYKDENLLTSIVELELSRIN